MPADLRRTAKNNPAKGLDICMRRAEFLLLEARSLSPEYDHAVVYALRVISNWISVGGNFSSRDIRWRNKRVSKKAWDLYHASSTDSEWLAGTINEHPEPLSAVWAWICENCAELRPEQIIDRLAENPIVTVTKEEDRAIGRSGMRACGLPSDRHGAIELGPEGPPPRRRI